jgi:predicted ArsR family transcriptional regulator
MNSVEHRVMDGSSRAGVLNVMRERGGQLRVEELAEAVGLSLSAVRFHLDRLIADGLVRSAREPRLTPGRPRVIYQAMPEEAVDDAAAYRRLAALLADELAVHGGEPAAEHAGRVWAEQLLAPAQDARGEPGPGRPARIAAPSWTPSGLPGDPAPPASLGDVLSVLENGGFSPRVLDGGWTIELHRCPFEELMPGQAETVCTVHRGLLKAIPDVAGAEDRVVLYPAPEVDAPCMVRFRH